MNRICITGRLTKDSEAMVVSDRRMVLKFTLAWSFRKRNGEEEANFFNVALFGNESRVRALEKLLKKGVKIGVEGSLRQNKWTDSEGKTRSTVEIHAEEVEILSFPKTSEKEGRRSEGDKYDRPKRKRVSVEPPREKSSPEEENIPVIYVDEEDIPF